MVFCFNSAYLKDNSCQELIESITLHISIIERVPHLSKDEIKDIRAAINKVFWEKFQRWRFKLRFIHLCNYIIETNLRFDLLIPPREYLCIWRQAVDQQIKVFCDDSAYTKVSPSSPFYGE